MLETNEHQLVELSVVGSIASPTLKQSYRIHPIEGKPMQLPSVGGISYNANLGDPAVGIMADHVEPGVSIRNADKAANMALNTFACIGNKATVLSGEGKGSEGYVTGTHGGVEHVMIYFPNLKDLDKLTIGDTMQIRSMGTGLTMAQHPEVTILSLAPTVLHAINKAFPSNGTFNCPITHTVPAHLLGAGLGEDTCQSGDVDIQLFDEASVKELNLDTLRFGDMIAMVDCDHRYGRIYRKDWLSIGVITHSCCVQAGHGPGVTTIFTGPKHAFDCTVTQEANLNAFLTG